MKKLFLITIITFSFTVTLVGQDTCLYGGYSSKRKDFHSYYGFGKENFLFAEVGDLGAFFGKGTYKIDNGLLVLTFLADSTKAKEGVTIIPPKVDTLNFKQISKKKFEIEFTLASGKKYHQRYKLHKARNVINPCRGVGNMARKNSD